MSFLSRHTAVCDKCNTEFPGLYYMHELIIALDKAGWHRGQLWNSEVHYCPNCPRDDRVLWYYCLPQSKPQETTDFKSVEQNG